MTKSSVGQIEKRTQARVVALFRERLGYDYIGNLIVQDNRNIAQDRLTAWLTKRGVSNTLIARALHELNKAATDTRKSLTAPKPSTSCSGTASRCSPFWARTG